MGAVPAVMGVVMSSAGMFTTVSGVFSSGIIGVAVPYPNSNNSAPTVYGDEQEEAAETGETLIEEPDHAPPSEFARLAFARKDEKRAHDEVFEHQPSMRIQALSAKGGKRGMRLRKGDGKER